jgi:hypothetical protein
MSGDLNHGGGDCRGFGTQTEREAVVTFDHVNLLLIM